MKKKTILIAHNFAETSFSVMSYDLSFYFAQKGHRVIFISHKPYFKDETHIECGKGEIVLMSWATERRPTTLRDFKHFYLIYKKYKPNVVIAHFAASNICSIVSKTASLGATKTLVYYHTLSSQIKLDGQGKKWKESLYYQRKKIFYWLFCDHLICPSELAKSDLKNFFKCYKGIVLLNPMRDRNQRESFIEDPNEIVLSYLGRLNPSKGVNVLIEAFNNYKEKNPQSKIILNLAGSGEESSLIKEKIKDKKSIFFKGSLAYKDVDDYIGFSHFMVIPSKSDNLPTVGLEALMKGTPLLISNKTGLASYINENIDCFVFSPEINDIELVLKKVEDQCYDYIMMRKMARETFERMFTMRKYCINMSEIIL